MKTTTQTILPDNNHEHKQPIYEVKRSRGVKIYAYFVAFILLFTYFYWGGGLILWISGAILLASVRDIYFYEGYVETRSLLPSFMNREVISYDKMHVHIYKRHDRIRLNHYETLPKLWESPYAWLKTKFYPSILLACSPRYCTPEMLEFIKTKAQSISYYTSM